MAKTLTTPGPVKSLKRTVQERIRNITAEKVAKRAKEIVDAQIEAAIGLQHVVLKGPEQKEIIMKDPPSTLAARFLYEFSGAKPAEKVKHTGGIGIIHLVTQLEQEDETDNNTEE